MNAADYIPGGSPQPPASPYADYIPGEPKEKEKELKGEYVQSKPKHSKGNRKRYRKSANK